MKKLNFITSTSSALLNTIGSAVVSLLSIPFIISNVGLEVYGLWAYIFISQGVGSLLVLGVSKSLIQNMAHSKNNFSYWFAVKRFLIFILVCIVGVTLLAALILDHSNVEIFGLTTIHLTLALTSFSLCCMSSLVYDYSKGFFEAINKVYLANIYSFLQTIVLYLFTCVAIFYDADLVTLYMLTSVAFLIIATVTQAHIYIVFTKGSPKSSVISFKYILLESRFFFGFSFLTGIFIPLNRLLIATGLGGAVAHAIFDVALKLALVACGLLNSFSTHLHAYLRLMVAKGEDTFRLVRNTISSLFVLYLAGLVAFYFLSDFILDYFSLEESAKEILLIMLICIALSGVCEPALKALWSEGNASLSFQIKVLQLTLNVILFLGLYNLELLLRVTLAYCIPLAFGCICYVFLFFYRHNNEN
jgi:O-antigen/teichoic acid export membrane protein